ncbi:hypothetical protein GCM10007989_07530 [Devosia pacifica]|uniref:Uncharacterized protein n=1 Tax=Devosia pacifica TaxID=1335967 RepID=A0A918VNI0_9HYPH|nr:hypothetical protein GCM10007989_07530 [Devosia pacifica]
MMPSELVDSGKPIIRRGDTEPTQPQALVSWCDHPGCTAFAPHGYRDGNGRQKTYCREHKPENRA